MADPTARPTFAVCVADDGCDDLTTGRLYQVLPDDRAGSEGMVRVVDDSGEDYLYPSHRFVVVKAAEADEAKLLAAAHVA